MKKRMRRPHPLQKKKRKKMKKKADINYHNFSQTLAILRKSPFFFFFFFYCSFSRDLKVRLELGKMAE